MTEQISPLRHLRCRDCAGRHSVLASVDGKLVQMEEGPFLEFLKAVLAPLNSYLVEELGRMPISPARVARVGLADRRSPWSKWGRDLDRVPS